MSLDVTDVASIKPVTQIVIKVPAGEKMTQRMSVMDIFQTLAEAAGIEPQNYRPFDSDSMWPAITRGQTQKRDQYYYCMTALSQKAVSRSQ